MAGFGALAFVDALRHTTVPLARVASINLGDYHIGDSLVVAIIDVLVDATTVCRPSDAFASELRAWLEAGVGSQTARLVVRLTHLSLYSLRGIFVGRREAVSDAVMHYFAVFALERLLTTTYALVGLVGMELLCVG